MKAIDLELAAIGAGVEGALCWETGKFMMWPDLYVAWDPLNDNETAFLAAIQAGIRIEYDIILSQAVATVRTRSGDEEFTVLLSDGGEPDSCTREAIVLALMYLGSR